MNKEVLKQYEELKRNKKIINTIELDFFFELVDYLLKENEELKREIEKQKDINIIINKKGLDKNYEKALEKTMTKFLNDNVNNDYILKQKVKDKIEELKQEKKKYGNCLIEMYEDELVNRDIKILQELLESEK